jgi:predicted deacylase
MTNKNVSIQIGETTIRPGERKTVELNMGKLYTHTNLHMPVQVINGKRAGPVLFVSAAVHGDELNGVEIIRRLLKVKSLNRLKGTLIAVPIVNLYGFIHQSRYLPDRRDLNRSFPGTEKGSLAGRVAHLFLQQIVSQCTHGIDLHTGAIHRSNFPQIRANLDDEVTLAMAKAFDAPLMLNSDLRDGSLRAAAMKMEIPILLYEAGEALRFDEVSIRAGVRGVINVMRHLGMLSGKTQIGKKPPVVARSSYWIRAPHSGIFRSLLKDGERVVRNETLIGMISDPFGETEEALYAKYSGIIIGQNHLPLVNEGEALFHIARVASSNRAEAHVENFHEEMQEDEGLPYPVDDIPSI